MYKIINLGIILPHLSTYHLDNLVAWVKLLILALRDVQ